jgi:5-methylcytosine-specific restriction endonuclease McrA
MAQVLVLNASYEPLNLTSWKRAIVLVLKGKAEPLEHQPRQIYVDLQLPSVIRLRQYVQIPYQEIPLTRRHVFHRDNHRCQYCGIGGDRLTLDHVLPRSRGGGDSWENIVTACARCNHQKGNRTPREAGMVLRSQPRRPASVLSFEISRHLSQGRQEWRKYVIGA